MVLVMTLAAYREKLEKICEAGFLDTVKREVAGEGLRLVQRCFDTESDPYGKPWIYVPDHPGHQSVEVDSGALRSSFKAMAITNGVKFYSLLPYAARQNYGYTKTGQPARLMLPNESAGGLPQPWKDAVKKGFEQALAVLR
jgi:hypothetical protein